MSASHRIPRYVALLVAAALLGGADWTAVRGAAQAPAVLESAALRVEVTTQPYSYAIVEKGTGLVLLRQAQTSFTAGTARSVASARIDRTSAIALEATLTFSGSDDTARVRWTFTDPAMVQVHVSDARATRITGAFVDHGEHNYGLWEYS